MNLFLIKSIKFLLIFFSFISLEIYINYMNVFYFRNWEKATFERKARPSGVLNPFYSNYSNVIDEIGDLGFKTKYAIKKKNIQWKTDIFGFRNEKYIKSPEIIISGASNIVGSGLSQNQILSYQLKYFTNYSIYNYAPLKTEEIISLLNENLISIPKIFIYGISESQLKILEKNKINFISSAKIIKGNNLILQLHKYYDIYNKHIFYRWIKSRLKKEEKIIIKDKKNRLYKNYGPVFFDDIDNDLIASYIIEINKYCLEKNIEFIFFIIPTKETIHWEDAGLAYQPKNISLIQEKLKKSNVNYIDIFTLFKKNKLNDLYIADDTHWNEKAIKLVSKNINEFINKTNSNN